MRVLCVFGRNNYGDPSRGEGYEYINFIPSLQRLGHQVEFLDSWGRTQYHDFAGLNKAFLQIVEEYQPQVVLSVLTHYEIWLETWQLIKDSGIAATVNWTTDDSWKYNQFSRLIAPVFHAFTTTYPDVCVRYHQDGIQHVMPTQWAANATTLRPPLPAANCKYPVTFVGTAHGKRKNWIASLNEQGIKVDCFGYGWDRGPIKAAEIPEVIQNSVISLNFANGAVTWNGLWPSSVNQIKARTFEVPGAGGFLLTEPADGLDRYYQPDRELVIFKDLDELAQKIRYYLSHPELRDMIAYKGYERTCRDHTYDRRLSTVIDYAIDMADQYYSQLGKAPSHRIDWATFDQVQQAHQMDWKLRALRNTLVSLCRLVWGKRRGVRAARRLVFEFSWRLAGKRTYSASGWPGRMFYDAS